MALLTWLYPDKVILGNRQEIFYANPNLGVIFTILMVLVIVINSSKARGVVGALIIVCLAFVALLFAYLNWWPIILRWLGNQSIYLNLGFYLIFSTALFVVWFFTIAFLDHLNFWRFRPGQVTHEYIGGAVDKSYDTDNIVFSKRQDELFRHWVLGLGAGDLHIQTMGGRGVEMEVDLVLTRLDTTTTRSERPASRSASTLSTSNGSSLCPSG
jgi:hypothetical protein